MLSSSLFWRLLGSVLAVLGLGLALLAISVSPQAPSYMPIALGIAFLIAGLLAAVFSLMFARRIADPMEAIRETAESISRGDIDRRFPSGPDEFGVLGRSLNRLADDLRQRLSDLGEEQRVVRTILSEMRDGVVACDRRGRTVFVNQATARLFQLDLANAFGRPLVEVIRSAPLERLVHQVLENGKEEQAEFDSGSRPERRLRAVAAPISNPADDAPRVIVFLYDITEATAYESLRKQFVANVSHELRTPVSIIQGYLETLQDGGLSDPKAPEFVGRIYRNVRQLANLVDDLLQLSRLESESGIAQIQSVGIRDLVQRVVSNFEPMYSKKRQTISVVCDPAVATVRADPILLERACANFLDNAVKYTPEGGRIEIRVLPSGQGWSLEVQDTGIGIPAEDLPRIFERFYRVDKSRSREMGGTGLGLAIVKHIAQIHGGRVGVNSTVGEGSTFSLWLPE
jgi:two-component system phosphate regulon sensor histidine kinase PhoR